MKATSFIILLFFFNIPVHSANQENKELYDGISTAFKTGDVSRLSNYLNLTVDIIILEKEGFYKKNIVEIILNDLFKENKPKTFVIRHQGTKNDAQYLIANLETEKSNFRVYILLKKIDSGYLIHRLQIDIDD
jgi:hypothetical protein